MLMFLLMVVSAGCSPAAVNTDSATSVVTTSNLEQNPVAQMEGSFNPIIPATNPDWMVYSASLDARTKDFSKTLLTGFQTFGLFGVLIIALVILGLKSPAKPQRRDADEN